MLLGHKYRLYPTKSQETWLNKVFGCSRYVYNWGLELRSQQYKQTGKSDRYEGLAKKMTLLKREPQTLWLNEVPNVVLQQSLIGLEDSFRRFFKKLTRYPKKRKCSNAQSATFTNVAFRFKDGSLQVAGNKSLFEVAWDKRGIPVGATRCTVSREPSGKYFVSFLVEAQEPQQVTPIYEGTGLDVGLKTFAVDSRGVEYHAPKKIFDFRKKLVRLCRQHSRKQKGSKNREKARVKLARGYEKVCNIRKDFHHKTSLKIVRENGAIFMENLNVKGLIRNKSHARKYGEIGLSEFRRIVKYKAAKYGRKFALVGRFEPTTQRCSSCGELNKNLSLSDRFWDCPSCGVHHDRDTNAAINILAAGTVVLASGAHIRPAKSVGSARRSGKNLLQ